MKQECRNIKEHVRGIRFEQARITSSNERVSSVNHNFSVAKRIYDNQTVMQDQPSSKSYFPNKNEDASSSRWPSQPQQKLPTIIIVNQFVPPQYDKNCVKQDKIPYESLVNLSKISAILPC